MAITISVGYGERITSAGINDRIASLAGKNFKIQGLETRFTNDYQVTVGPGKCVVEGAIIESDADIVVDIPEELRVYKELAVVGQYIHGAKTFKINVERSHYDLSNVIAIANIDMKTRGCENIDYNLQNNELFELLNNPGKTQYKTFTTESGQEIVFDTAPYVGECESENYSIKNRVVQDGLLSSTESIRGDFSVFTVIGDDAVPGHRIIGTLSGNSGFLVQAEIVGDINLVRLIYGNGSKLIYIYNPNNPDFTLSKGRNVIIFTKKGNHFYMNVNGSDLANQKFEDFVENDNNIYRSSKVIDMAVYNRELTPQEMDYNLKIVNDFSKPITVGDAVPKQEVVSASIEGQTVKNIFDYTADREVNFYYNGWNTYLEDGYIKRKPTSADKTLGSAIKIPAVEVGKTYTVLIDILYNGLTSEIVGATAGLKMPFSIPKGATGTYVYTTEAISSGFQLNFSSATSVDKLDESQYLTFRISVFEGDAKNTVIKYTPFGLNSTKAIITHNDKQYPIYKPKIDGKTRVMKATKGTTNWVEISPGEVRDTAKYDYKLVSNGDLGRAGAVYDYIDRARKVKVVNTNEVIATSVTKTTNYTNTTHHTLFTLPDIYYVANSGISDKASEVVVGGHNTVSNIGKLYIGSDNTVSYISALNSSVDDILPLKFRYRSKTPIEIPMTDEEIAEYDAYREVIELGGIGVAKDTLEVMEDGSGVWTQNTFEGSPIEIYSAYSESIYSTDDYLCFYLGVKDYPAVNTKSTFVSNVLEFNNYTQGYKTGMYLDKTLNFCIAKSELISSNESGVRQWFYSKGVIVRYRLATPITTIIPKELMPKIKLADKTIQTSRIKLDSAVAGKFTLTAPTTPNDGFKDLRDMMLAQKAELEAGRTSVITSDGEEIVINQGPETGSAAIAKIAGRTVKNHIIDYNSLTDKRFLSLPDVTSSVSKILKISNIELNKKYTIICKISKNTLPSGQGPGRGVRITRGETFGEANNKFIDGGVTGIIRHTFNTPSIEPSDFNSGKYVLFVYPNDSITKKAWEVAIDWWCCVEGDGSDILGESEMKDGLNSTQATLTAKTETGTVTTNIYEPTIEGLTKVMKATKGKTDWVEISPDEVRDAAAYDYKLVSNGDLGSAGTVYDYIDRARKVKVINTKETVFDGSESWGLIKSESLSTLFYTTISDCLISASQKIITSNNFKSDVYSSGIFLNDTEGISGHNLNNRVCLRVLNSKLNSQDTSGLKQYLQSNPVAVRYQLTAPTEVPLTDGEIAQYDQYREVIELNKVGDVADELIVNEDGSGTWIRNTNKHTFTGRESINKQNYASNTDVTMFEITDLEKGYAVGDSTRILCSNMQSLLVYGKNAEGVFLSNSLGRVWYCIKNAKLESLDSNGLRSWFTTNTTTITYQLDNPVTTQIPKELMPQIPLALTNGQTKLIAGGAVKPSALEINRVHGDKAIEKTDIEARKVYSEIEAKTNGLARIVGGKVEGRTVKNLFNKQAFIDYAKTINPENYTTVIDGVECLVCDMTHDGTGTFLSFKENTSYTIRLRMKALEPTMKDTNSLCSLNLRYSDTISASKGDVVGRATNSSYGFEEFEFISDYNRTLARIYISYGSAGKTVFDLDSIEIFETSKKSLKDSKLLPGLNSSKAIIKNGDFEARVYNPVVTGRTKVMKATKGAQDWKEISPTEIRDTAKYDYKLVNVDDLGGISNAYDYVDLARKVKVVNTGQIVLDGSQDWIHVDAINKTNSVYFTMACNNTNRENVATNIVSDTFVNTFADDIYYSDKEGISVRASILDLTNGICLRILKTRLSALSASALKTWLSSNPITVRYKLAMPIEVSLTDDEVAKYSQYKEVIELAGIGDIKDSIQFNDSGAILTRNIIEELAPRFSPTNTTINDVHLAALSRVVKPDASLGAKEMVISNKFRSIPYNNRLSVSLGDIYQTTSTQNIIAGVKLGTKATQEEVNDIMKDVTIMYVVDTPEIVRIPREFIEYLPIHRGKNELTAGGTVKADIVENLQLEFNDNVHDKAPIPTIKDDKITGLYLPELKKHFELDVEQPVVSNPNLLINGDFRVWQRGEKLSMTKAGYSADRWYYHSGAGTDYGDIISKTNDGLLFEVGTKNTSYWRTLTYFMDQNTANGIRGKTVTFSVSVEVSDVMLLARSDGKNGKFVIYSNGAELGYFPIDRSTLKQKGIYTVTAEIPKGASDVRFAIRFLNEPTSVATDKVWFKVNWAKVEIGDVATPFQSRPYEEELLMCKRYYHQTILRTMKIATNPTYGQPVSGADFPVPMRTTPTWKVVDNLYCNATGSQVSGHPAVTQIGWNKDAVGVNGIELVTFASAPSVDITKMTVELDAEIY